MGYSEVIATISLIVSIVALRDSKKTSSIANKLKSDSNNMQMAEVELNIRQMIEKAKKKMDDIDLELKHTKDKEVLIERFKNAKEIYANVYDEACMKYLDGKVDKVRFKNTYVNEIKNLVEDENFKELYVEPQSKYKATNKVYNEWHNYEK